MKITLPTLRVTTWIGLIICMFLPFCRGCDNAPFVPASAAFKNPQAFLFAGPVFLYPLLLLAGWLLIKSAPSLTKALYTLNLVLLSGLGTLILYFVLFEQRGEKPIDLSQVIIGISVISLIVHGIASFASKQKNLLQAIAFHQSALSLIWIAANIFWNDKILYGGWLSLAFALCATILTCPFFRARL